MRTWTIQRAPVAAATPQVSAAETSVDCSRDPGRRNLNRPPDPAAAAAIPDSFPLFRSNPCGQNADRVGSRGDEDPRAFSPLLFILFTPSADPLGRRGTVKENTHIYPQPQNFPIIIALLPSRNINLAIFGIM